MLWIAFRLYLWLIEHNHTVLRYVWNTVVNCFQIVSLTYWTQLKTHNYASRNCCELLSDCIFDLLNTTAQYRALAPSGCELLSDCIFDLLNTTLYVCVTFISLLWIAFRLYLWLIEHNFRQTGWIWQFVVNCFQIVSLTYWTQLSVTECKTPISCELLSDCIFDLLNTTRSKLELF